MKPSWRPMLDEPDASVTVTLEPEMPGGRQREYAVTPEIGEAYSLDMPGGCW